MLKTILNTKLFWIILAIVISIFVTNPAIGLIIGIAISIIFYNPQIEFTSYLSRTLLKLSIVLLGFGLNLSVILKTTISSIPITVITISFTMILGYLIGKLLKIDKNIVTLISSGTAICGGSAIAAIAPTINASSPQIAISMTTIFLLNAVALIIFPPIATYLGLSQEQFGLWAAIAIHDTSSVVGAAATYGATALMIATTVKLTRTIWIMPLALIISKLNRSTNNVKFPLFILGFIAAAAINTFFSTFNISVDILPTIGKGMMSGILFLIGAGLTINELKKIGVAPLILAIILWITVSILTLLLIYVELI